MFHFIKLVFCLAHVATIIFSQSSTFNYLHHSGLDKISFSNDPQYNYVSDDYVRFEIIGSGHTAVIGEPELPLYSTFYQLDPSKNYEFDFEVIESYFVENIKVFPHQGMKILEGNDVLSINSNIYESYKSYPEENMLISNRSEGRGIEFVSIQVIPFKYYPKSMRLEVFTNIEIIANEIGEREEISLLQSKRSHIFDEFYKDLLINFENSSRPDDYQASSILYIAGGDWLENAYVQDLIHWRHKQGYLVTAVSTSDIGTPNGSESIIKNYIQEAYETWDNPPEIVGLIGDTDVIDCFYQSWGTGGGWNSYNGSTDSDYSYLAGNDLIPEVYVGRISGQGVSTMENVVNKTIQYEKALYVDDDWFKNSALVGDPSQSGNSTIFTSQYIENIMINYGMSGVEGYYYENGITNWLVNQFNEGILYYNYRGIYGDDGTDFSELSSQINNGYKTPFATVMTCGTGDFDEGNSQTEEFVKYGSINNPKGAVGAIGLATTGTHTAYNNILNMGIYDGIFVKKLWYAGAAEASGDLAMVATYPSNPGNATEAFTGWTNLIGDPALHLWSDVPVNFAIDYPDDIPLGTTSIDVIVYDDQGNTVENATVTLLMGDDIIFSVGKTNETGQVSLDWDNIQSGTVSITVIKRNYRPYEGEIEIASSSQFSVGLLNEMIYLESGKEQDFTLTFKNYGEIIAKDLNIELVASSDYITIYSDNATINEISPNQEIKKTFSVYTHGTAYYMEDLGLQIIITDLKGNSIVNHVPANVSGPYLNIVELGGDIFPGSNTKLIINLENIGNRFISNFQIDFAHQNEFIDFLNPSLYVQELYNNQNIYLEFDNINFSSEIINGTVIPIEMVFTSMDGKKRNQTVSVTVGEVRESDPLCEDLYGYCIYDINDTEYDLAPVYDWIEIADGIGEQLNLVDYGNGNYSGSYTYSSEIIDLPFIFTFYGIDYSQIIVNTNGWISFGDFKMYSFRNYPIPGAGGPSPMIAAFWDDLKTGSGGYVHYYESNEKVIIQWDDMRTYDNNGVYRETFQIILYNKELLSPTVTGDSEVKIQYQEFKNTSDGYYPNGGTPTHGCYSTIGIENHLSDLGLEYTFNNTYPEAAARLEDETAIFITTGRLPRINLSIQNVNLSDKTLDIYIDSQEEVAGFQFEILGIDIISVEGGLAEENDFMLSSSSTSVLGFSITGTSIPIGSGVLVNVSFDNFIGSEICFGLNPVNNVVSNIFGNELEVDWGGCYQGFLMGDLNFDNTVDILDLVTLANLILDNAFVESGDLNQDSSLDILDIVLLINIILE